MLIAKVWHGPRAARLGNCTDWNGVVLPGGRSSVDEDASRQFRLGHRDLAIFRAQLLMVSCLVDDYAVHLTAVRNPPQND
jgi:hypothetical protein